MADTPHGPEPRVVRLAVSRPATNALSAVVLGGALLLGGGAAAGPPPSAGATDGPTGASATGVAPSSAEDWDVTPRDLLVGQRRDAALALARVLATRLGAPLLSTGAGAVPGSSGSPGAGTASLVGPTAVPEVLWSAYRSAASSVPTSCHQPVGLLAAIGQVESGSLAGRGLDSSHRAVPAVLGPVLDGHGYAAIADTDRGRWDHDTTWDRAVGPMQFIPSTWARWARDGNGDGVRDPQSVEDSAWSAASYLCAGGRDLSTSADLRSAILSYNHSAGYLADVLRLAGSMTPGGALPQVAAGAGAPVVAAAVGDPVTATTVGGSPTTATTSTTRPTTGSPTSTGAPTTTTSPPTSSRSTTATGPPTTASSTTSAPSTTPAPTTTTPSTSPTTCPGTSTGSGTPTASPSTTTRPSTTASSSTTASPSTTTNPSSTASPSGTTDPGATPDPCATTSSSSTSSASTTSSTSAPATATSTSTEGPGSG